MKQYGMVEQPYYEAELSTPYGAGDRPTELRDAINTLGEQRSDYQQCKFDTDPEDLSHVEIEIGSWVSGPLLYIEEIDADGQTILPSTGKRLTETIMQAGYVPTSFRPERDHNVDGGDEHTGRWMWYLRPIEDVRDEHHQMFETVFALQNNDGTFVRTGDGDLVEFETEGEAEAVRNDDQRAVEVNG